MDPGAASVTPVPIVIEQLPPRGNGMAVIVAETGAGQAARGPVGPEMRG